MTRIAILLILLAVVSCSRKPPEPHIRISVYQTGRLLIDGEEKTLAELAIRLDSLKEQGGTVWYYREQSAQPPPAVVPEVLKMVVEKGLPITLSSKPDFSDYIGEDGRSHRRKR